MNAYSTRALARLSHALFVISSVASFSVHAQSQPHSDAVIGREIVVTATRFEEPQNSAAAGVTVIDAQQIRNSTATTIPELLKQQAGIQVRDNSGSPNQQVDMRGFGITGDQNTLVLLDGQRISENEQTTVNWAAIPLSSIERIEIMRGSGAVLYGGGATGGTINIITKAPQSNNKSLTLGAGVGNYGTADYQAGLNIAGENLGLIVNGSQLETDNFRVGNQLRQREAQADLRLRGSYGSLYTKFGADDQYLQLPGSLTEAQIRQNPRQAATPGDFSHMSGGFINVGGNLNLGAAELAMNAGYRARTTNSSFFVATPFRNNLSTQVDVFSLTPRARIPYMLGGRSQTLVTGVDWDEWDYDSTAGPFPSGRPLAVQRDSAWYAQNTSALTDATTLTAGVRLHRSTYGVQDLISSATDQRTRNLRAFEIGLRHQLSGTWSVYGKFGNSFRVPNINDNYNLFTATIALLEPQTSHDREIGTQWRYGNGSYRAALYQMDINNEIHLDPVAFNNVNLPPTRRWGVELEGNWKLTSSIDAFANYTYAIARFRTGNFGGTDVSGKEVPLVPHSSAHVGGSWTFAPRTSASATVDYVGTQVYDGDETNAFGRKMPAYTLANLKLTHTIPGGLQLSGEIKNLFNKDYYSYAVYTAFPTFNAYPAAERQFFASVQYKFQ